MQYSGLEQSIIKTLCYFDVRGVCLRLSDLERYVGTIKSGFKIDVVEEKDGFYFLKGRGGLVEKRILGEAESKKKMFIVKKAAKLLKFVPFMRAVLVCNSVSEGTAREESDIDLLIVADMERIWIVRFFSNLLLKIFRLRTGRGHDKNKICLSYFIDANNLNFSGVRIAKDDVHKAYWILQLLPIYDLGNFGERIIQANGWVKDIVPNTVHARKVEEKFAVKDSRLAKLWRGFWERSWGGKYGKVVEGEAKKFQMTILEKRLGKKINAPGFGVVINDGMIKLHERDTRVEVRDKWLEKIRMLNVNG